MPSLMAARWVGQNSGSIFRRLWNKVHWIKCDCVGLSIVCNAAFRLTISCCVSEIFSIKSRSCAKSGRKFDVLGRQISGEGAICQKFGWPKFLTEFYKSGWPSNTSQSLVTIGQATTEIRRRKKKDLNDSGKTEWPAASIDGGRAAIINDAGDTGNALRRRNARSAIIKPTSGQL